MKNVLITGGSGGVGKETVKYLSQNGYFVYSLDIKPMNEMKNVKSFICDLRNSEEIKRINDLIDEDIVFDSIIHFSGIYLMDSLIEIEENDLKKIYEINFFSVFLVNKIFFNHLRKGSKIIITSSEVAPLDPLPFNGLYSLTKCSLEHYAASLRQELNLLDIKVIIIRPGAIDTSLIADSIKEVEKIEKKTYLYKDNANKFKKIVEKNESKKIKPIRIAKLVYKILNKKKPKILYKINLNKKLIFLSILPQRLQLFIIKKLLKKKERNNKDV